MAGKGSSASLASALEGMEDLRPETRISLGLMMKMREWQYFVSALQPHDSGFCFDYVAGLRSHFALVATVLILLQQQLVQEVGVHALTSGGEIWSANALVDQPQQTVAFSLSHFSPCVLQGS